MKKIFVLFFLSISILFSAVLDGQTHPALYFNCQDSISIWMAQSKIPAIAIGIIDNNKIRELKIFGELNNNVPITKDALFNVASLTKPVVAVTVLELVNIGLWKLDEPVSKYWIDPDIKNDLRYKK